MPYIIYFEVYVWIMCRAGEYHVYRFIDSILLIH